MRLRTSLNVKGLRDVRTRSGRVDRAHVPYMAYMKISCLEMEKARRSKERQSAQRRIANIDARVAELDAEKDALLIGLGERRDVGSPGLKLREKDEEQAREGQGDVGFKIRY